jgi:hypothetical protein
MSRERSPDPYDDELADPRRRSDSMEDDKSAVPAAASSLSPSRAASSASSSSSSSSAASAGGSGSGSSRRNAGARSSDDFASRDRVAIAEGRKLFVSGVNPTTTDGAFSSPSPSAPFRRHTPSPRPHLAPTLSAVL